MADSFLQGNKFYLKLTIDAVDALVVCKTDSTINFTNTSIEVRNQCTGDYPVRLPGGQKAGSIDFTGDYNLTPTSPNISAFGLAQELGNILPAIWGGIVAGQEIVEVDVQVNNVSITASDQSQITFSATLDFAGTPVFSVATT